MTNSISGALGANGAVITVKLIPALLLFFLADLSAYAQGSYIDVTAYGVRATPPFATPTTTCTTTAGSTTVKLPGGASTFKNGDGFVCRGAGRTFPLPTPAAPTMVPSNASGPTGTGQMAANATGANTNQYCVVTRGFSGYSPCSPVTSVSTANTLGVQTVNVASWTQSGVTVTVTTASAHNLIVNTYISIVGDSGINGFWKVATVPDKTHFTFQTQTATGLGHASSGGSAGTIYWWQANHITWAEVANALQYLVYGRTAGAMKLIGVTTPQSSTFGLVMNNPGPPTLVANEFDDYGPTMTPNTGSSNVPDWFPLTPPVAAKNNDLITIIVSGGGTTTLVVADAATNAVTGATAKFDNAPTIKAAATAAASGKTVLFLPVAGGNVYQTSSILDLRGVGGDLSVEQAANLALGDTMILGKVANWTGFPVTALNDAQFTRRKQPSITSSTASPMIYSPNAQSNFSNITVSHNRPGVGYAWIVDEGGGIPADTWENMIFSGNTTDYMNMPFLWRGDSNGGSNCTFTSTAFIVGPASQSPGQTTTPLFYGDGMGNPTTFFDTFLNRRGMYWRMLPQGLGVTFNQIYEQGGITPMVSAHSETCCPFLFLNLNGAILDTMGAPAISYSGALTGAIGVGGNTPGSGQPMTNGPGNVVVTGNGTDPSTIGYETGPAIKTVVDGIVNSSPGRVPQHTFNGEYAVGTTYQFFVQSATPATPTCSVSAGGSVPLGNYNFNIAPTFPTGFAQAEGTMSRASTTCSTTKGNQTITVNWTAVTGATGYDLYENGRSFQCYAPWINGGGTTNYVWASGAPCGQSLGSPGGGVTGIGAAGLSAPAVKLNNIFAATLTSLPLTAPRSITMPDASGTVLLDTTATALTPRMLTRAYTNSTTTASNITGLSFLAAANTNYGLVCHLYYQGSVGTAGLDITVTGPSAPVNVFYSYDKDATGSVASAFGTKLIGSLVRTTANLHAIVTLGLMNGANAGMVQVQGSATGAGTVTVQPGSFCKVQ
jgi:hypothetical protein